ncbi:hypothetical protein R1flu_027800 [Riccia fluitans]|uniref:Uncharacterized protein n=1 Tax=Riccia fluitans TaxID=41844 RepID=A0ABD1XJW0_9MARC
MTAKACTRANGHASLCTRRNNDDTSAGRENVQQRVINSGTASHETLTNVAGAGPRGGKPIATRGRTRQAGDHEPRSNASRDTEHNRMRESYEPN